MKIAPLIMATAALFASLEILHAQPPAGTVLWSYNTGGSLVTSPALSPDGTVYVAGFTSLYAITNSGSTASNKWTVPITGEPSVGSDGTIYLVAGGANLVALNPDGSQKWNYQAGGGGGCPAIAADGTVYFESRYNLYAVTAAGTLKWKSSMPGTVNFSSVAIGSDGTIYAHSWEGPAILAFTPDGTQKWLRNLSTTGGMSPAIGAGGTIYVTTGPLYAFAADGTQLWSVGSGEYGGAPAVGGDGTIYVPDIGRTLHAFTPAGQHLWSAYLGGPLNGAFIPPALVAGGSMCYCVSNSAWGLNSQGQVQWLVRGIPEVDTQVDSANSAPIIGPDGTIYAAVGPILYAISSGTNGPAKAPWPMYQHDARHTGSAQKAALSQPQKRSDANFQFELYAQLGQTQTVQASTDLFTWSSVTNLTITNVPMDVVDLSATNFARRFYRTVSE